MSQKFRQILRPKIRFSELVFFLCGLTIPLQLGKHFWPHFSFLNGVRVDYLSPTLYLSDLILLLVLIIQWKAIFSGIIKSVKTVHPVLGILILILAVLNFSVATSKWLFVYRLYQYAKIILTCIIFSKISKKQWQYFLRGLSIAAGAALILALWQIKTGGSLQGLWYYMGERQFTLNSPGISTISLGGRKLLRAYAFFSHPNSLAGFFLPLVFLFLIIKKRLPVFICTFLVCLSFSKFSLFFLAVLFLFWQTRQKDNCRLCHLAKLGLAFWLILLTLFLKGSPLSLATRIISFKQYLEFVFTHPLGVGLGHYLSPLLVPVGQPVHNIFLLLTVELGWLVWPFLIYLLTKLSGRIKQHPDLLFLLLPLLLIGSFDHYLLTLNQNMLLLGVILGIILGSWPNRKILY